MGPTTFCRRVCATALLSAMPIATFAASVIVNGQPDIVGVSYQTLSGAVSYVQSQGKTEGQPHSISITVDALLSAEGEILINQPMTIEGDGNNNGVKCDILFDMAAVQAQTTSLGQPERCFIEIEASSGTVTLNNLKLHPNADCTGAAPADSVDGIRMYEPSVAGESGMYILNNVWISGSDDSNNYVDLATANAVHATTSKKWSQTAGTGTVASGSSAVIQIDNNGAGTCDIELNNCHAGLGESNAININSRGGTTKVLGGLYGHVSRDGIRITGNGVTLTGSPTNRLRVVRSTNSSGGDGHGIEIYANANVNLIEYVDVAGMNTSQLFKVWGTSGNVARVVLMQHCRGLGKLSANGTENNPAVLFKLTARMDAIRNCTFVGGAGSASTINPMATDADIDRDINIYDCIFTSEGSGVINAVNTDTAGGIKVMENCAIPNDAVPNESLAATPIGGSGASYFTPVNTVSVSPIYVKTLPDYDWSEAAVSVDGSNPAAGNPDVLRPSNAAYKNASSTGTDLTGGAGGTVYTASVADWSLF